MCWEDIRRITEMLGSRPKPKRKNVPRPNVQNINSNHIYDEFECYHGNKMSQQDAANFLRKQGTDGSYIVTDINSSEGHYIVSQYEHGNVKFFDVRRDGDFYPVPQTHDTSTSGAAARPLPPQAHIPVPPTNWNPVPAPPTNWNTVPATPTNRNPVPAPPTNKNTVPAPPTNWNPVPAPPTNWNPVPAPPTNKNPVPAPPIKGNPGNYQPPARYIPSDKWYIRSTEVTMSGKLGSGQFGVVSRGVYRKQEVAVKTMNEGVLSEQEFISKVDVLIKLQHRNLVKIYGICSDSRFSIVTEYMRQGSLLEYVRRHEQPLASNFKHLLASCIQVCEGMAYLESNSYIHGDLAARNCLVDDENVVKVTDFGIAKYLKDDQYTTSTGPNFPTRWASIEVINDSEYSSKSDVWAFGVMMWEVLTCGEVPYGRLDNFEVVQKVRMGQILRKPEICLVEVYEEMRKCWRRLPKERPSFQTLAASLSTIERRSEYVNVEELLYVSK